MLSKQVKFQSNVGFAWTQNAWEDLANMLRHTNFVKIYYNTI